MREAVIVSTARTPIGVAFKGALNNIKSPTMMGHAIQHAVERAGVDPGTIEDVVIGSVLTAGTAGMNVARLSALAAVAAAGTGAGRGNREGSSPPWHCHACCSPGPQTHSPLCKTRSPGAACWPPQALVSATMPMIRNTDFTELSMG